MQILMIFDTLILAVVIIESFFIGLALAAWLRAHKSLEYTPKWAKLDDLSDNQIEEIKAFLRKLRSGNDAAETKAQGEFRDVDNTGTGNEDSVH